MGLIDAILPKSYKNARTLYEADLDAWREKTEDLLNTLNLNLRQVGIDTFGGDYEYNNDGAQSETTTLNQYITNIIDGTTPIDGTKSDTFTINSDGNAVVLSSAGLTAQRTITFADESDELAGIASTQTFTNKTMTSPVLTTPDINGGTWQGTIDGNWTAAGETCADLGTVATVDINGGTVDAITALTVANDVDIGSHKLKAEQLESDIATGTAPFVVASTTMVANLNAGLIGGAEAGTFVQTTGDQSIAGEKTFSTKIIDKNGNEVVAMITETILGGAVGAGLSAGSYMETALTFSSAVKGVLLTGFNSPGGSAAAATGSVSTGVKSIVGAIVTVGLLNNSSVALGGNVTVWATCQL